MTKLRVVFALAIALVAVMAISGVASAKAGVVPDPVIKPGKVVKKFAALNPTVDGQAIAAEGKARIVWKGDGAREISILVETIDDATGQPTVPAGTTFDVTIAGIPAGQLVVDATGHADLDYSNDPILDPGAQPITPELAAVVENIALNGDKAPMTVTSTDGLNTLLLTGSF
jgi:hypothetical protein